MKRITLIAAFLLASMTVFADGTVTTPANIAPVSWKIASVVESTGAAGDVAGITITVYYFDASNSVVRTDAHSLTNAEILSFITVTNAAVAGESGSQIKRRRQRVTKWMIDNGKLTNVTPES